MTRVSVPASARLDKVTLTPTPPRGFDLILGRGFSWAASVGGLFHANTDRNRSGQGRDASGLIRFRKDREVKAKNRRSGRKMSDAIFVAAKAAGRLKIGDKKEIDRAIWRRPHGIRLTPTSRYIRDRPSLSFGNSSLISLRRQSLALSRARLRPPGNIQRPSRFRLSSSTRPRFAATSFEDFAMPIEHRLSNQSSFLILNPVQNYNVDRFIW
jgi:hypothetical protein